MKKPTGKITYEEDHSISYSGAGRNPPRPWVVRVDGSGVVDRDKTYVWAAYHLAHELTWRDPEILRMGHKIEQRKKEIFKVHLDRLTDEGPAIDMTDPQAGRHQTYEGADWTCGVCYKHGDHPTPREAQLHGCSR